MKRVCGFHKYQTQLNLSVYPPMKWEGILDAVNRLLADVAERWSIVAQRNGLG